MTTRPPDLRIPDLSEPRYSAEVRQMMGAAVDLVGPVSLEADPLLDAARAQTGLDDFGDPLFLERLQVLLESAARDAGLSPFGNVSFTAFVTQTLKNRLLVEDLLRRHPEILEVPITAPIIIAGLQRTGTTHLHNLLAADPQLRHLPYWESLEPVLAEAERPAQDEPDPRELRCEQALEFQRQVIPHFNRMHEMTFDHAHEEIQLLAIDFSTMLFEAMLDLPGWRDYYLAHDQTPHYEYLKKVLQVLTWLRGGVRWVLKTPQHIEQIGPLVATFPDATVIFTHRDPISVVASTATMIAYSRRVMRNQVDLGHFGEYWADRTETMLRACVRDRDKLPADQSMDVLFHDYMRDDMAVVRKIYALAKQPLGTNSIDAMSSYVAAHPRGRFGRVEYKLSDFGLDPGALRERFRFYTERFGLDSETVAL
jgi:hypothetical protein